MQTYTVKAKEPTVLHGHESYELSPSCLMLSFTVETVHIVPGDIDIQRFNDALSATMQVYPLQAGRLQCPQSLDLDSVWKIRLVNAGAQVDVVESDSTRIVPINSVVQSDISPLVHMVNPVKLLSTSPDDPLLKVTITRFTKLQQTAIGLSSSHIIGDGFRVYQFVRLLSQNYQGLPPLDEPPTFIVPPASRPEQNFTPQPREPSEPRIFELEQNHEFGVVPADRAETRSKFVRMDFRFTSEQIARIKEAVIASGTESEQDSDIARKLSRQDALAAFLAKCFSDAEPQKPPVAVVSTVFNYRSVIAMNQPCLALVWALSEHAEAAHNERQSPTMLGVAMAVRQSLVRMQDPEYFGWYINALSRKWHQIGVRKEQADFSPPPGIMTVNSTWRLDWTSPHFGFAGKCRFHHTNVPATRYVKIFTPNPTESPDGTWKSHSGAAEVTFNLENEEARPGFLAVLRATAARLGIPSDIEVVQAE